MGFMLRSADAVTVLVLTLFLWGITSTAASQEYQVTVTAGAFDRQGTVVSYHFPEAVEPGHYRMSNGQGETTILQVDSQNRGWFILESLPAGSSTTYTLNTSSPTGSPAARGAVTTTVDQNTITYRDDQNSVLSFYHDENNPPEQMEEVYKRAGYIHPVFSPQGVPLTNHLDPAVHPHHYGIWAAWTNTEFMGRNPDFWNIQDRTARVTHADTLDDRWTGAVHGGLKTKNYYVDLSSSVPIVALNEQWELRVYNTPQAGNYHMFDLVVTQTANTAHPLNLPQYHYGGMAFRGHQNWNNPENVSFLTSAGLDRSQANETRARWSHMGGLVDGRRAGIAVLGHPGNTRAPQPVRIHPETPYFVYAPEQLGAMQITPGSPHVMRYRYITYDGKPDPEQLDRLWRDYAYPPGVTIEMR